MKIGAISLGCDKNRVDLEKMIYDAIKGHEVIRIRANEKKEEFEDLL